MVIKTKSVLKYVLHCNIVIEFLHFDELGPCVYIKLKKYVDFHEILSTFLTYMDSYCVEMVSLQRPQRVKILNSNLTEYKIYS